MKKIILTILTFCLFQVGPKRINAQGNDVGVFVGNIPNKIGVQIKWFSKELNLDAKYNLYRKESTENKWTKINSSAIERAKTISQSELNINANSYQNDSAFVLYNSVMNKKEEDKQLKMFLVSGLVMQSIRNNKLALNLGLYFEDLTVIPGKKYTYRLTYSENEKEIAASEPISIKAFIKKDAPSNFQLKAMDAEVKARWKCNKIFPLYKVQRSSAESGVAEKIFFMLPTQEDISSNDTSNYFFTDNDSTLVNGKPYFYKVSSLDYFGNESVSSISIKAVPKDLTGPSTIQGLKATFLDKKVTLSWRKTIDTDLKGYNIYRSLNKETGYKKITTVQLLKEETFYKDDNIVEGMDYYYYVEAEDKSGNFTKSMMIPVRSPDLTAPEVPKNVVAKSDTGKIFISWDKNIETDIAGYYVYFALKDEPSNYNLLNKKPIIDNRFIDTLPRELNNYFIYKIAAADKNYNISVLSDPVYVRMPDVVPPPSPTIKNISIDNNSIVISWLKPSLNTTKGFLLQRREGMDTKFIPINTKLIKARDTSYNDENVESGKTYTYSLISVDSSNNNSKASNALTITYNSNGIIKTPSDVTLIYDDVRKEVKLNWQAINQPKNFEGYIIFRKEKNGNYFPLTESFKQNSFVDVTVERNNKYFYLVNVIDNDGTLIKNRDEKEISAIKQK